MKKILLLLLLTYTAIGQEMQENLKDRFRNGGLNLTNSSAGIIYGFDNSKSEIIGTAYYSNRWAKSNIKFYPITVKTMSGDAKLDTASNVQCKLNLLDNVIEIIVGGELKGIDTDMVKEIQLNQNTFVNIKEFEQDKFLKGMVERIVGDKIGLYAYNQITIKKPDFNPALNAGSKDYTIKKEIKYMVANGKKLTLISNKKSLNEAFGAKYDLANKYINDNDFSIKNVKDLVSLVNYLNQN